MSTADLERARALTEQGRARYLCPIAILVSAMVECGTLYHRLMLSNAIAYVRRHHGRG